MGCGAIDCGAIDCGFGNEVDAGGLARIVGGPRGVTEAAPGIEGTGMDELCVDGTAQTPFGQFACVGEVMVPKDEATGTPDESAHVDAGVAAAGIGNALLVLGAVKELGAVKRAGATPEGEDIVANGNVEAGPVLVPELVYEGMFDLTGIPAAGTCWSVG